MQPNERRHPGNRENSPPWVGTWCSGYAAPGLTRVAPQEALVSCYAAFQLPGCLVPHQLPGQQQGARQGRPPHPPPGPAGWACWPHSGSPSPVLSGALPGSWGASLLPAPAGHRPGRWARTTSVHTGAQSHMIGPAGSALTSVPVHPCPPCLPAAAAGPICPSAVHVTLALPGRGL